MLNLLQIRERAFCSIYDSGLGIDSNQLIVRVVNVTCVALVPVPVTVRMYVPETAHPVDTVSELLLPDVIDIGENVADAPAGRPLTLRLTVWEAGIVVEVSTMKPTWLPL